MLRPGFCVVGVGNSGDFGPACICRELGLGGKNPCSMMKVTRLSPLPSGLWSTLSVIIICPNNHVLNSILIHLLYKGLWQSVTGYRAFAFITGRGDLCTTGFYLGTETIRRFCSTRCCRFRRVPAVAQAAIHQWARLYADGDVYLTDVDFSGAGQG